MNLLMKINQQKLAVIILLIVSLSACQESAQKSANEIEQVQPIQQQSAQQQSTQLTQEEKTAIEALAWAQSVNLENEFNEAIRKEDFRVWVIAGRGAIMPGIDSALQAQISKNCGHRYLPGVGDTLRGDTHRAYRKKAVEYAKKYNQKMQAHCLKDN